MSPHITPADVAAIVDQIAAGIAPVDRATDRRCNGEPWPDARREYFCQLPGGHAAPWRVARVTVYREPWGTWRLGDVDVFTATDTAAIDRGGDAAREILAAVDDDGRAAA